MRWWVPLVLLGSVACSNALVGCESNAPQPAAELQPAVAHGDHSPHHGGVVMMKGDVHYEVVLQPSGQYRLYFTDAMRTDLPASTAVRASITIMRDGEAPEGVELQIDESGESWVGQGKPVANVGATKARIAYTLRGEEPYWIDLAFDVKPTRTEAHQ